MHLENRIVKWKGPGHVYYSTNLYIAKKGPYCHLQNLHNGGMSMCMLPFIDRASVLPMLMLSLFDAVVALFMFMLSFMDPVIVLFPVMLLIKLTLLLDCHLHVVNH